MDIARALLDAVRDDPDDDLPRLAYADWLMEQPSQEDQARGEFIQLQLRLARNESDDPALDETRRREAELLAAYRSVWLGKLERVGDCELRRGFVRVTITGEDEAHHWQRLSEVFRLPEWGIVMGLRITGVGFFTLPGLVAWPGLADLPELDLEDHRAFDYLEPFDTAPPSLGPLLSIAASGRMSCLRLSGNLLADAGVRRLLKMSLLVRLVRLAIEDDTLSNSGIEVLTAARLPRLRDLSLKGNALHDAGMETLAGLPHLRRLCLARNSIRTHGVHFLAGGPFPHLEDLDLSHNGIGDHGARALLDAPFLPRLRRLRLEGNGILDKEVRLRYREMLGARVEL